MPCLSITRYLDRAVRRFAGANEGNIAIMFGAVLVPLLGLVGAAIDYSRANMAHSSMQAAIDSTALMLSKDLTQGTITTSQISQKAQDYFNALFTNKDAQGRVTITTTYTPATSTTAATIKISGSGSITTDFMNIIGFPTLGFSPSSTTTWGNVKMRVALVLDNTGSMAQNNKMTALKNAVAGTGGLIDQLSALAQNPGDVYISVVPFAKDVNLDATNYSQNWIDWTDWLNPPTQQPNNGSHLATLPMNWHAVGPDTKCPFTTSSGGFTCTTDPTSTSNASFIPSSGTYSGYICPSVDSNSHTRYNGCWDSEVATPSTGTFCSGSSQCSCPKDSTGSNVTGCSCTGSNSSKSCSISSPGKLYVHNWTQPGPTDATNNLNQPRVGALVPAADCTTPPVPAGCAAVGFAGNQWTATNSTPTVQNRYVGPSTNPISTWTGCIADRTQPNDTTGVAASDVTTEFPANQYYENNVAYCSSSATTQLKPITPLSYDWSALKTAVNAMQTTGGTNQAVGLAWGWQTLLTNSPVPAPAETGITTYNRVIILLSDGLNTEDRWPDYGNGSTQTTSGSGQFPGLIDARQKLLCDNLKNARDSKGNSMYTVYTIQVNTSSPADPTSTILQYCASSPDKFYMLTSSTQIVTTFRSIGIALSQLRVAM
ncbi:MAG: pilus assembly protein [Alphaproteobacteria bacterium]|nr:MAG: pilus assembly protein [Alphaproteobacteria bacterium]